MSTESVTDGSVVVRATNIGGIDDTEVSFDPGVTVLAGRNATNRTSFLKGLMLALGSDDAASLKGDSSDGSVELLIGDERYTRTLTRQNGDVVVGGDPYLDDPTVADLFAFLLESNDARRAVERGADLRGLIMRPVDTEAIQADIEHLEAERDRIDDELDEIDALKDELPALEQRRGSLESEIEEARAALDAKESAIEAHDTTVEDERDEKAELEAHLDELRERRDDVEEVRSEIDLQRGSLDSLTAEHSDLEETLDDLPDPEDEDSEDLETALAQLRDRKERLETQVSDLQNVISFNEELLEGVEGTVGDALDGGVSSEGSVTDQLVDDGSVVCWTCGSEVAAERIEQTLAQLRDARREKLAAMTPPTASEPSRTGWRRSISSPHSVRSFPSS
uniref:archaea-specific SMC-related protein n=1 Tax=Halomarina oriensis TaxID=671145 RepID=UPI0037420D54